MSSLFNLLFTFAGVVLLVWAALLAAFARQAVARWREPVFRRPILVLESDDWGAGPVAQAGALRALLDLLRSQVDGTGRRAVMTLGVVFEVPDGRRMASEGLRRYHARTLDDEAFGEIREAIAEGIAAGVFVPELHGQCHYWPDAVLAVSARDAKVAAWLAQPEPARNEDLPSHLQSRWVDGSTLPSRDLDPARVDASVVAEANAFQRAFGGRPAVAVATTFVWNDVVEAAWRRAGIDVVVTPGQRCTGWDAQGNLVREERRRLTGESSRSGQIYLVRDLYFEPAFGHRPDRLVDGVRWRSGLGRASLVEIHRANFLDELEPSLAALQAGFDACLTSFRELRFASTIELAEAIRNRDGVWLDLSLRGRLRAWLARLPEIPRFHRLARVTGFDIARLAVARLL